MKIFYSLCLLFCNFAIAPVGIAQTAKIEATELIKQYRANEKNFSFEISMLGKESAKNGCLMPFFGVCKPFDEMLRIKKELNVLADAGDVDAMFYTGILKSEYAKVLEGSKNIVEAKKEYELAAEYYKRAGDNGSLNAYWNVAIMYERGRGVVKSNSAAIEWFYKAGIQDLKYGRREEALAAYDAIKALDKEHRLGKRLQIELEKNEPK
jgi:TPR repeat protein